MSAESYYGRAIIKGPTWKALDIAGYFFLGGLAGASSVLAAGFELTGRARAARASKLGALGSIGLSMVALVHDLGKPSRFYNMLRVFKPTSPMSVGSWLLGVYMPLVGAAAAGEFVELPRGVGRGATVGAAVLGPAVASYTAVLVSNTAVPAWRNGRDEMPYVFVGSAAAAASGFALVFAPVCETAPARRVAVVGAAVELVAGGLMERGMGASAECYREGRAGRLMKLSRAFTAAGAVGAATLGRRSRAAAVASGAALLAGSACTRFGIFEAGRASAADPKYVVADQR
ncbi:MAG: NrfD/PsrC family molybdoenzyme membrane anchor subunit [Solirubrobacteraceae bacterium]